MNTNKQDKMVILKEKAEKTHFWKNLAFDTKNGSMGIWFYLSKNSISIHSYFELNFIRLLQD